MRSSNEDRQRFVGDVTALLAAPFFTEAQQAGKSPRVGYLVGSSPMDDLGARLRDAFRDELREWGYVEGKNLTLVYRWAQGRVEQLPALAAELAAITASLMAVLSGLARGEDSRAARAVATGA